MLRISVPSSYEISYFQLKRLFPEMPFLFWQQASLINCVERRWEVVCYITEYTVSSLLLLVFCWQFSEQKSGKPVTCIRKGGCVNFLFLLHSSCCLHSRNGRNMELDMSTFPKYIGVILLP